MKILSIKAPKPFELDFDDCNLYYRKNTSNNNNNNKLGSCNGKGDDGDNTTTNSIITYELLPETFTIDCIVRRQSSKAATMQKLHLIPSPKVIYDSIEGIQAFGPLNEIEYSANFRVFSPIDETNELCYRMIRYYYISHIDLYVNGLKISNNYMKDSYRIKARSILRSDYSMDTNELIETTSKLKLLKDKFNFMYITCSLTGSIEVKVPELMDSFKLGERFTRKRYIIYWYLQMIHRNNKYNMRIAFRRQHLDQPYECNVECEDAINGNEFIEIFDLIYKYYKTMAQENKSIQPLCKDIEPLDLTRIQLETLSSFQLVSKDEAADTAQSNEHLLHPAILEYVKCLGIMSYNNNVETNNFDIEELIDLKHVDIKDTRPTTESFTIDDIFESFE